MALGRNSEKNIKHGKHVKIADDTKSDDTRYVNNKKPHSVVNGRSQSTSFQSNFVSATSNSPTNGQYIHQGQDFESVQKSYAGKKIGIVFGVILAILALIYFAGVFVFSDRVYPNTTMGDTNISMMSADDLRKEFNNIASNYKLKLNSSYGFTLTLSSSDISLENANGASLKEMLPNQNPWTWPLEITRNHNIADGAKVSYNRSQVEQLVSNAVDTYNASAQMPANATLAYNAQTKSFTISPEVNGTALDKTLVTTTALNAIDLLETSITLDGSYQLKPTVLSNDSRLIAGQQAAQKMLNVNVTYTIGGTAATVLNADVVGPMVVLDANFSPQLNTDSLNAWANSIADSLCTVGSTRTYTRPDGKVCTVKGGVYGWEVDTETFANQVRVDAAEGTTKTVAITCESEGNGFTAIGSQDWGARYIDVDLSEQHVRFYDKTGLIWEADCVSGSTLTEGHATPQGVWEVNAKESPSKLIGYKDNGEKEYETQVQFWMPFEGNGVGFHDATWQPGFGGNLYQQGYGSHGCINLSYASAESLYGIIVQGDVVVVHE